MCVHCHVSARSSRAGLLLLCPADTVRGELRVRPEQPVLPTGGRGSGPLQPHLVSGQASQQGSEPGRRQRRRLLQPTEQVAGAGGETGRLSRHSPGDSFSHCDYSADILVLSQPSVSPSRHPDSVLPSYYNTGIII